MDLRCPHRKYGEVTVPSVNEGRFQVTCPSRFCGKRPDVTVLHTFSTKTGELLSTRRFRTPMRGR